MISKRPWISYFVSLALHVGAFAGTSFLALQPVAIPYGHYKKGDPMLVEIGIATPAKTTAVKSVAHPQVHDVGDIAIQQKKEIKQEPQQQASSEQTARGQIGFKDGIHTGGELGHSKGFQATAKERYLFELHVLIEGRKVYPSASKRLRETGKVTVEFTLHRDGSIADVILKSPSHFDRLNSAATELISGIKRYKPLPEGFEGAQTRLEIPIEYSLN